MVIVVSSAIMLKGGFAYLHLLQSLHALLISGVPEKCPIINKSNYLRTS